MPEELCIKHATRGEFFPIDAPHFQKHWQIESLFIIRALGSNIILPLSNRGKISYS